MKENLAFVRLGQYTEGTSQSTGKEWRKQDVVFETLGDYPKTIVITFFNDKADATQNLVEGAVYEVNFDIESREFNGKYYTNLNGWLIVDPQQQQQTQQQPQQQRQPQQQQRPQQQRPAAQRPPMRQQQRPPQQQNINYEDDYSDDLPF